MLWHHILTEVTVSSTRAIDYIRQKLSVLNSEKLLHSKTKKYYLEQTDLADSKISELNLEIKDWAEALKQLKEKK